MAKNAPSKTSNVAGTAGASPAPAGAHTEQPPAATSTPGADANTETLKALLDDAEAELDARDEKRPTPEQLASEIKTPEDIALLRMALALAEDKAAKSKPVEVRDETLVRVFHLNRSKGSFIHGEHRLDPGASAVVPKWIADLWIGHVDATGKGHVGLQEGEPLRADPEKAKLAAENQGLNAQIKALEMQLAAAQAASRKE